MPPQRATLDDIRRLYADMMAGASGSSDPRLHRAFESIPREAFLPPGPWKIPVDLLGRVVVTPTADPAHLYQNTVVSLDETRGINTGEQQLHAIWIGAAAPQAGETVTQIGTGGGYYTAILAMLALPNGTVTAYELDAQLAADARRNLAPFDNVDVRCANAVDSVLPPSDIIYVNAGVVAPARHWLQALRPGGRMMFPWRPTKAIGLTGVVIRRPGGYEFKALMQAFFIPCVGADDPAAAVRAPDNAGAWRTRSIRLVAE